MRGEFDFEGYETAGGVFGGAISFPLTLSAQPTVVEVPWSGTNPDPTHCSGTTAAPTAAPGYLCIYDYNSANLNPSTGCSEVCVQDFENLEPDADVFGARLITRATSSAYARAQGSWAVTAA